MATGSKSAEEFRFDNVQRTEPRGARLWIRDGCESVDGCIAAGFGGAESVSVAALGLDAESIGGWNGGCWNGKPIRVHNAAFLGKFGIKSDRPVREPAIDSQREHQAVQSERKLTSIVGRRRQRCQPLRIELRIELQPAQFIRRERIQRGRWRKRINAGSKLTRILQPRRGRRRQRWRWPSVSYDHMKQKK